MTPSPGKSRSATKRKYRRFLVNQPALVSCADVPGLVWTARIADVSRRGMHLILQHPAVENVACVALPDPALGERMCACIIPHTGKTLGLEELVRFLAAKEIAKFKLPERLELRDELPRNPLGKIRKRELRDELRH